MSGSRTHPALQHVPHGWFHHGEQVIALVEQYRPLVAVELGTHRGGSAVPIARVLQGWGGVLYCVDTWAGIPRPGKPRLPYRLYECAVNAQIAKVNASLRLIPAKTTDAAQTWRGPIDFLYIDADHSYEGVKADLAHWAPFVRPGGLIAGDDYDHPHYPGVNQAWDEFEQQTGIALHRVATPVTKPPGMRLVYGEMKETKEWH